MGEWRHFGSRLESADAAYECVVFPAAPPDPVAESPPGGSFGLLHAQLASVIEGEILPRLMLAHRETPPQPAPADRRPSPEEVARFCTLLLARGQEDVTPHVMALLDEGLSLESLLLDLLTPAARHIGTLWEEDACDFVDVTLAIGRLQAVTRELCAQLEDTAGPGNGRSILISPCPGETHLFGPMMVASFFREAGWAVATAGTGTGRELCDLARREWFDVIGLSLSCEVNLPAMVEAVRALRGASRNRSVRVIVGGPHFARAPDNVRLVGADAMAGDGRIATVVAENLLEKRARAC